MEERPNKKARLFGSLEHMVTLVVGKNKDATFTIHQDMLCEASPFFKAACKPEWMKPDDRVIKLPEDDKDAIKAMVYWMYHDEIYLPHDIRVFDGFNWAGGYVRSEKEAMARPWGFFAKIYVLAEKYQIPRLQNDAIDAWIIYWRDDFVDIFVAPFIYENTISARSPLRRLLVTMAVLELNRTHLAVAKQTGVDFHDLFFDMAAESSEFTAVNVGGGFTWGSAELIEGPVVDFCKKFHIHEDTEGKCAGLKKYFAGVKE